MRFIVETKNLSKRYSRKTVVKDLDLKVPGGCVYGFMGPNGAGKSTTMKMLLGLIKSSGGQVWVDGKEMNAKNRISILNKTGSLIESPSYYGHLSGKENLEIVQTLKGIPKSEIDKVLKLVRMENQQDKKVREYSLGMKQRLGLAEALLGGPRLLLLDEPTNGLDPAGITEMRGLICELPKKYGITVLISSHLLSEMDQMADYVGIINQGQLIFQDKLEALHEHSKSNLCLRVADQAAALRILKARGIPCALQEDKLLLPSLPDEQVSRMIAHLIQGGVDIYRVEEQQKTLEEIFLNLTGRGDSL